MKILYPIGHFYPSQSGGPANTVYWIAKALTGQGVKVFVISTNDGVNDPSIKTNEWMDRDAGRVIYTKNRFHQFPVHYLNYAKKVVNEVDIVHLTSIFHLPSTIIAFWATRKNKRIVWSPRGELDAQALIYSTWKKLPILWVVRNFFLQKVIFHTTAAEESENVKKIFGDRAAIVQIPNYLDLPAIQTRAVTEKYLLYIGRIHPKKAVENLIQAAAQSKQFLETDVILKIAGDNNNEYGNQLKKMVTDLKLENKIKFVGHIEGVEKQVLYANAYYTFMPSHTENFGNVVIESLAQGTPVVASTGTPWQALANNNAGYWIDNDADILAGVVENILTLSEDQYAIQRTNALALGNSFDIKTNIYKWLEFYKGVEDSVTH